MDIIDAMNRTDCFFSCCLNEHWRQMEKTVWPQGPFSSSVCSFQSFHMIIINKWSHGIVDDLHFCVSAQKTSCPFGIKTEVQRPWKELQSRKQSHTKVHLVVVLESLITLAFTPMWTRGPEDAQRKTEKKVNIYNSMRTGRTASSKEVHVIWSKVPEQLLTFLSKDKNYFRNIFVLSS